MEITTTRVEAQRVSHTHCLLGPLALRRLGIEVSYTSSFFIKYSGTCDALLVAGLVDVDQLPGNGYVNTKRFINTLGQRMRVTRRGKARADVTVQFRSPHETMEYEKELGVERYVSCLNAASALVLRSANSG